MQARLIKTAYATYVPTEWNGINESGWVPTGDRILVLTDRVPARSKGGIEFTDDTKETNDEAAITGVLIAVGEAAFTWNADRSRAWSGAKPEAGMRIMFQKYAGELLYGNDDRLYRVMDDRAIGALMPKA
jgi:co-chaperonin GroES (HSP10)